MKEIDNRKLPTEELEEEELKKRLKWYEKSYGPYIKERGLRNWKNLFKKPTSMDLLLLFIIAMVLVSSLLYKEDVRMCHETLETLPTEVCEACSEFRLMAENQSLNGIPFNLSGIIFTNIS